MKRILAFILARFPVVQKLKERKNWISALVIVLSALIALAEQLSPLFPGASWLLAAHGVLVELLKQVSDGLGYLGL